MYRQGGEDNRMEVLILSNGRDIIYCDWWFVKGTLERPSNILFAYFISKDSKREIMLVI